MKKYVYIVEGEDLNIAIAKIFGYFPELVLENKNVFVKPNMLRIARPEECIITDPALIAGVVDHLIKNSAHVMVGDNPIPQKVNEIETAKQCGFYAASRGRFKNVGRFVKKVKIKHRNVKEVYVSREIIESEILISLPKFKTHELTILSIAIKNQFGIIPGGLKPHLHYQCPTLDDFCELLIEIYNIKKPDLIIVDALNIVDARGRKYRLNKLIAGTDGWAVDYVCALIAGIKPEVCPVLRLGIKKGMLNPEQIVIKEELPALKGFKVPLSAPIKNILAGIGSRVFARIQNFWAPALNVNRCNQCHSCANVCPARAIYDFKIDYKKCIKCYCCLEVCPQNAIKRYLKII
ncbi:MAG: DUF362 domain-containing protein [candidate division WOR-3 bacterium]